MRARICARLIVVAGIVGLAQVRANAQATLDSTQSQFGTGPAPYAQPAQPVTAQGDQYQAAPAGGQVQAGIPVAQPVLGGYAPPAQGYAAPSGYGAPAGGYAMPQDAGGSFGAPDPSKPLGRGDIVTFAIAEDREAPQIMRVTDTGELDFSAFPNIGRISVAGKTCAQVASELKRKLEADYYYKASVMLGINQVNHLDVKGRVYLTGNVRAPGPLDLLASDRNTVSTAIIRAGGFALYADDHNVQVTRKTPDGKTIRFKVDVAKVIKYGRQDLDREIQDGDYINVPQHMINF